MFEDLFRNGMIPDGMINKSGINPSGGYLEDIDSLGFKFDSQCITKTANICFGSSIYV